MKYTIIGFIFAFTFLFSCQESDTQNRGEKLAFAGTPTANESEVTRISPLQKAAGLIGNSVCEG